MNFAIIRRWLNILVLSLLGMATGCFLLDWQRSPFRVVSHLFSEISHQWLQIAAIILFCALIAKVYLHFSPFRIGQIWSIFRYPPTWLAIVLAYIFVYLMQYIDLIGNSIHRYDSETWLWSLLDIVLGCFLVMIFSIIIFLLDYFSN